MIIFMILMLLLMVAMLVLLERKILSLAQIRKSPNIISFYSVLQTVMDSVKLMLKKFLLLPHFFFFFFMMAPSFAFSLSLLLWMFIYMYNSLSYYELMMFLFIIIMSLNSHTIVWASWSSFNIYSLFSAIRAVAQVVSYEVVLSFFIFTLIIKSSVFSWIIFKNHSFFFFFFFFSFLWMVIMLAEMNRTPFDLVEGESELVGSYNVEFSSASFTLLFLAEYLSIWLMSFIFMFFFLFYNTFMWILVTSLVVVIRSQLPRFKFMDLISLAWKVMLIYITLFIIIMIM